MNKGRCCLVRSLCSGPSCGIKETMNLSGMDSAFLSNPQVKKERERRHVITVKGRGAEEAALSSD